MHRLKIGIIGCGAMGSEISKHCQKDGGALELTAICDIDGAKASRLNDALAKKVAIVGLDDLIAGVDLVVEAASGAVAATVVEKCVKAKKDCLIMSVGGLLGREELLASAEKSGVKAYIPSGAICGIDGLKAALTGTVESVTLTTRKPPKGLEGAPYLKEKKIDLSSIKGETVIFEGSALEAVKAFPQNVNVSAVLSLAGIGSAKTRVRIVTAPEYTKNIHEVEIAGEFGRITTRTENLPSAANPKTSALAIFAAIATLDGIARNVRIGT